MARVILDSGAIIALSHRDDRARAYINRARRQRDEIVIPVVVVTETTRGTAQDAPVNQIFREIGVPFAHVTERKARLAAGLLGRYEDALRAAEVGERKRDNPVVDAIVAAEAFDGGPAVVLTSDTDDLSLLLEGHDHVRIYPV